VLYETINNSIKIIIGASISRDRKSIGYMPVLYETINNSIGVVICGAGAVKGNPLAKSKTFFNGNITSYVQN